MHPLDCPDCKRDHHRFTGDWCHVGGIINFTKLGHETEHENYGWPHVIDRAYSTTTTNCIYCGIQIEGA